MIPIDDKRSRVDVRRPAIRIAALASVNVPDPVLVDPSRSGNRPADVEIPAGRIEVDDAPRKRQIA